MAQWAKLTPEMGNYFMLVIAIGAIQQGFYHFVNYATLRLNLISKFSENEYFLMLGKVCH
jgi:hypothetical protein